MRRWRGRLAPAWPHLRAASIGVVLCATVIALLPGGPRMGSREVWRTEQNRAQFVEWANSLSELGIRIAPRDLEHGMWRVLQVYSAWQRPAASTLEPILTQTGARQSWRMFSNPQTHPARLHVELDQGSGFRTIHVSRSDEHAWRREQFDHNRLRKVVGRVAREKRERTYRHLVEWIAENAERDFPDAKRVRVRLFRWRTPAPGASDEPYDTAGRFEARRVLELGPR